MALNPRLRPARRSLIILSLIIVALFAGIAATVAWQDAQWTPKLGLDLEGGTQLILEPVLADPGAAVSEGQVDEAKNIMTQRIDGYGVAEAEVTTLGGKNIVISIPGKPDPAQLEAIRKPSQLRFRAVLVAGSALPETTPTTTGTATGTATPTAKGTPTRTATGTATAKPSATTTTAGPASTPAQGAFRRGFLQATPTPTDSGTSAAKPTTKAATATPTAKPTDPSDLAWVTADLEKQFAALDCNTTTATTEVVDDPAKPLVACAAKSGGVSGEKYILGPVELDGTNISNATSGYQPGPNGQPSTKVEVALSFDGEGKDIFGAVTTRLYGLQGDRKRFAIVLDRAVITAPTTEAAIVTGQASITGSFTLDSARVLARQIKFGALPLSFKVQTEETISPQLGDEQLRLGLLAGLIGLILVVLYSLLQYRALGLVTVASLVVAAVLTFGILTFLGWAYNFRLTMAGVTGVIVSIGVTADSFIVYFERIRDEVRDGRPLVAAVEAGWARAKRTILAADAVNFLAAAVLYLLAANNVRGFAFTLGVTTLIDLIVVFLFTHPMVGLLANTEFFGGGHKWSGLDPERLGATGARYAGRGRFAGPQAAEGKA